MLQITPQMKILVAVKPAVLRRGIDGLARLCQESLQPDPFVGAVFVVRNWKGDGAEGPHAQAALAGPLPVVALGRLIG